MSRKTATALAALVGLLIALLALVELYQHAVRSRAESFLLDLKALQLGKSTFSDARRLQSQYGGQELTQGIYPPDCSARECYIQFIFTNLPLAVLRLAPPTALLATLHIQNGAVISHATDYQAEARDQPVSLSVHYAINTRYIQDLCQVFRRVESSAVPSKLVISMRPGISKDVTDAAFAFDLSCLSRLGTCGEANRILPPLFTQKVPICTERPDTQ